ncbi:unnamed protein product [Leptosia nina]|uniref:Serpin domain-containing protein n=1 Tax=Leptosia nina TaxID=320188 RepID=A0AAV1JG48_9NEOP
MTFVSATSVVLFLCLIAQSCPQLNDRSRFPPTTVNNLRPPTLYDLEKYCLYNDKWDLCPEETVTPTGVTSVTENPTSEVNQFLSTLDYELSDAEINNAIRLYRLLQTSHLIPKAIRDLFKYWNWMLMNSPTVYLNENINPAIFNSDGNEYKNYANQLNTVEDRHSADDNYKVSFKNEVLNTRRVGSSSKMFVINMFIHALDHVERTFYATTYAALISISPANRKENGISFALSGLFLQMALIAFSTEVDNETRAEINKFTAFDVTEQDKLGMIQSLLAWLPASSDRLKFKYATRLVLKRGIRLSQNFLRGAAVSAQIKIDYVNGTESVEDLTNILNRMVVEDSEGAMHNTFDEDELAEGVCAVLISTLYVRARWRSPPTLLNGTLPFYVSDKVPKQTRMVRINDMMRYIRLPQWDSEVSICL